MEVIAIYFPHIFSDICYDVTVAADEYLTLNFSYFIMNLGITQLAKSNTPNLIHSGALKCLHCKLFRIFFFQAFSKVSRLRFRCIRYNRTYFY